ncbi:unnamed protein product [Rangifer tarandus platyrhynchus]|uniref:Uncharacterized protein n=1 Tax=Rangifer tarandus platyrhynchus TaxID=3082113 RepID=A0ABN8Y3U8_RANTA|nr:unnamed protein product [Rangifer tarandus platyrhynchus]
MATLGPSSSDSSGSQGWTTKRLALSARPRSQVLPSTEQVLGVGRGLTSPWKGSPSLLWKHSSPFYVHGKPRPPTLDSIPFFHVIRSFPAAATNRFPEKT